MSRDAESIRLEAEYWQHVCRDLSELTSLVAVKNVLDRLERFGRLAQVSLAHTLGYIRDRWRVDLSKVPPA